MPSTRTGLHYHLIFATKNREPLISDDWRTRLHAYLGGTVGGLEGVPQAIGGVADHVHLLVSLKPTHCLADFVRDLKKASSTWAAVASRKHRFQWQEGYAAFTVSPSARAAVQKYIEQQEEHHRHQSLREELIEFLQKSGIEYDERYLD